MRFKILYYSRIIAILAIKGLSPYATCFGCFADKSIDSRFERTWECMMTSSKETFSALMALSAAFYLTWVWTKGWVNNRDAGDLRCQWAVYDVTVMDISIPRYVCVLTISVLLSLNVKSLLFENLLLNIITLVFPVLLDRCHFLHIFYKNSDYCIPQDKDCGT